MAQEGRYEIRGNWWVVRYRESVVEDGELKRILRTQRLASTNEIKLKRGTGPDQHSRVALQDVPSEVKILARVYLDRVNGSSGHEPEKNRKLGDFYTNVYRPHVEKAKAASTQKAYRDLWEDHVKNATLRVGQRSIVFTELWMKKIRTVDITNVLHDAAAQRRLSKNSLKHLKSFLSGIFTYAKQQGFLDGINPVQDAALPDGAEPEEQHAYSLEEIETILGVLPDPAATIFACASYAGFRRSELRGLRWEEYVDDEISVERGVWESIVGKTKTRKSRAGVPVIATLKRYLDAWRKKCGNPTKGWIFPSEKGTPLNLNNVLNRQILPALNRCTVCDVPESKHATADHTYERNTALPEWRGWHAARRGLGTNLRRLGVPIEIIQRILRHAKASTTQDHYILPDSTDTKQALEKIEAEIAALRARQRVLATKAAQNDVTLLPMLGGEAKIGLPS